ncbi:MAG: TetR/AcrR family transcriptional regulator [Hyphomonadaceae bacterium]
MSQAAERTYRGQSPSERKAERRAALIEAAVRVYGAVGYRNASVKAICEEAGLTERYFYESFAGSDALLAAAYQAVVARLHEEMSAAREAACAKGQDGVRAALRTYYSRLRESPEAARVFLVEIGGVSAKVDAVVREALLNSQKLIAPKLKKKGAAELVAAGIVGGVIQIALDWIASGYKRPVNDVVEAALRIAAVAES